MIFNAIINRHKSIRAFIALSICIIAVCSAGCDSGESSDSTTSASKEYKQVAAEAKTSKPVEVVETVIEKAPEKSDLLQDQNKFGYATGVISAKQVRQVLDNIPDLPEGWSRFFKMDAEQASRAVLDSTGLSPEHPPIPAPAGKAMKDKMTEEMVSGFSEGFGDFWDGQEIKYELKTVQAEILKKYNGKKPDWLKK